MTVANVVMYLRKPGDHYQVWSGTLSALPRVGEYVAMPMADVAHEVHSIYHMLGSIPTIRIYLNP